MRGHLSIFLFALLFALGGCVEPGKDINDATLSLSEKEVSFTEVETQAKVVTVTTNQKDWKVFIQKGGDWITAVRDNRELHIKVSENKEGGVRSGMVTIVAGDKSQDIEVTQSGTTPYFTATNNKVYLSINGSSSIIKISTNSLEQWTTELEPASASQWIEVEVNQEQGYIRITGDPNELEADRNAKLIVRNSSSAIEVDITQSGKLGFIMPLDPYGMGPLELDAAEKARGSSTMYQTKRYTSNQDPKQWWDYIFASTGSVLMPTIEYEFSVYNGSHRDYYVYAVIPGVDADRLLDGKYQEFISRFGFSKLQQVEGQSTYWTTSNSYHLELNIIVNQMTNKADIKFFPIAGAQVNPQKTLSKLPLEPLDILDNSTYDVKRLIEEEDKAGYKKMVERKSDKYPDQVSSLLTYNANAPELTHKLWFIATGEGQVGYPYHIMMALDDPYWGFYRNFGEWAPSNEYLSLLEKEGFVLDGWSWNNNNKNFKIWWFYKSVQGNTPHTIWLKTYPVNYSDFAPTKTRLYIELFRKYPQPNSLKSAVDDVEMKQESAREGASPYSAKTYRDGLRK